MILTYWFILIAGLMPYSVLQIARGPRFDNAKPRDSYAAAEGRQKRAYNAHLNSFEVFPFYAAAVLVALQAGMGGTLLNVLAGLWLVSRVGYIYAYLTDKPTWRSRVWAVGMLLVLMIITLPLWGPYPEGF